MTKIKKKNKKKVVFFNFFHKIFGDENLLSNLLKTIIVVD